MNLKDMFFTSVTALLTTAAAAQAPMVDANKDVGKLLKDPNLAKVKCTDRKFTGAAFVQNGDMFRCKDEAVVVLKYDVTAKNLKRQDAWFGPGNCLEGSKLGISPEGQATTAPLSSLSQADQKAFLSMANEVEKACFYKENGDFLKVFNGMGKVVKQAKQKLKK